MRSSCSSPSSSTPPPPFPMEFLCPISDSLMADPVIIPSGQTFERACIQACKDLSFTPSRLSIDLSSSSFLIPNLALKDAILNWCDRSALPHPIPISKHHARNLVRRLMTNSTAASAPLAPSPSLSSSSSSDDATGRAGEQEEDDDPSSSKSKSRRSSGEPRTPPISMRTRTSSCFSPPSSSSSSSSYPSSSSSSSSEIETLTPKSPKTPKSQSSNFPTTADSLEEEIFLKLKNPEISEQEAALISLRHATREGSQRRMSLCTQRVLAALRPMLLSRCSAVQTNAAASIVNLSLESPNKVSIVRSGAVPPLIDALKCGHLEARDHAAGALFSLALEDENRAAIGVLGAIPPLLNLFTRRPSSVSSSLRARREAGMALYHLSLASTNRSKLARTAGAVQALLGVAAAAAPAEYAEAPQLSLKRLALMVLCNLVGCGEGRTAMMDGGAVAVIVRLMKDGQVAEEEEEYCVAALYGMSRGSLRFRGLGREAGAEEVLMRVAEEGRGEVGREIARRTVRALRGEEEMVAAVVGDEVGSVVSDGLVSFRRRFKDVGNGSGPNSADF